MGDVNKLEKIERNKTMANLPGSIKNLNTLLGEQLLDGGGSGGGGESDFSIATLTFINGDGSVLGALANDVDNRSTGNMFNNIIKIILYKGQALIEIDGTVESTSGDIEDLGRDGWLVTGDCTITIS